MVWPKNVAPRKQVPGRPFPSWHELYSERLWEPCSLWVSPLYLGDLGKGENGFSLVRPCFWRASPWASLQLSWSLILVTWENFERYKGRQGCLCGIFFLGTGEERGEKIEKETRKQVFLELGKIADAVWRRQHETECRTHIPLVYFWKEKWSNVRLSRRVKEMSSEITISLNCGIWESDAHSITNHFHKPWR